MLDPRLNVPTLVANICWIALLDVWLNVPTLVANICWIALLDVWLNVPTLVANICWIALLYVKNNVVNKTALERGHLLTKRHSKGGAYWKEGAKSNHYGIFTTVYLRYIDRN